MASTPNQYLMSDLDASYDLDSCSGYPSPSPTSPSTRSGSVSPRLLSVGTPRSPMRSIKTLSEETFDIAALLPSDTNTDTNTAIESPEQPPLMMMVPISSRREYLSLLHEELLFRQSGNNSLRADLTARCLRFKAVADRLNATVRDYQSRCESMMRSMAKHHDDIQDVVKSALLDRPQKSTAMERAGRKLEANRISLYQHDRTSFYLWQRELQRFMAEIEGKIRRQALTAWDQGEIEVAALRNLVEIEKVEEYLLMERIQIFAEMAHQTLGSRRMECKLWISTERRLREGASSTI